MFGKPYLKYKESRRSKMYKKIKRPSIILSNTQHSTQNYQSVLNTNSQTARHSNIMCSDDCIRMKQRTMVDYKVSESQSASNRTNPGCRTFMARDAFSKFVIHPFLRIVNTETLDIELLSAFGITVEMIESTLGSGGVPSQNNLNQFNYSFKTERKLIESESFHHDLLQHSQFTSDDAHSQIKPSMTDSASGFPDENLPIHEVIYQAMILTI